MYIHLQGHSVRIYESLKISTYMWGDTEKEKIMLLKILVLLISGHFQKMEQFKHGK